MKTGHVFATFQTEHVIMRGLLAYILSFLSGFIFITADIAYAQNGSIEDILKDILEDVGQLPQTPIYETQVFKTVPIEIGLTSEDDISNYTLRISATIPDPSGAKRRTTLRPLVEMRYALKGIPSLDIVPLTLPSNWAEQTPYLIVDAELLDENDEIVFQAENVAYYRGDQIPALILSKVNADDTESARPQIIGFDVITGEIELIDSELPRNGSTLNIQLLENALAGGTSMILAAEKVISLTDQNWPMAFLLERALLANDAEPDLAFKVWISDWAGRKTHVMREAVAYRGTDVSYMIKLDQVKQGKETRRGRNLDPSLMAQSIVSGEAIFNPSYGIPAGGQLKIQLGRSGGRFGQTQILSEQTMLLRGMETRIPFSITTDSTNFDPLIPPPYLSLTLTDSRGHPYYASGNVTAREGKNSAILLNPL